MWLLLTIATAADPGAAATSGASTERRDLLLLLDQGPLHIRMHLAIGGTSLVESRNAYIDRLMKTLDADADGKLTRTEASRSPLFRTKRRESANEFLQGLQSLTVLSRREVEQKIAAKGSGLVTFRDISSSKNDLEVFKLLDRDGSGVLEIAELAAAVDLILSKDEDGDQCVSFEEFFPPLPPPDESQQVVLATGQPITQPTSGYYIRTFPDRDTNVPFEFYPSDINNIRLPHYARLDLSLTWEKHYNGWSLYPYLQFFNIGNRGNVWFLTYDLEGSAQTVEPEYMFPILPTLGVRVEF